MIEVPYADWLFYGRTGTRHLGEYMGHEKAMR